MYASSGLIVAKVVMSEYHEGIDSVVNRKWA